MRTHWQAEADRRWPDGQDMVEPAHGDGQWATVSWCGPLMVVLHSALERAVVALDMINGSGCGHGCWNDHELVDLTVPEVIDLQKEWHRGPRRAAHADGCQACQSFSRSIGPATMRRSAQRRKAAA